MAIQRWVERRRVGPLRDELATVLNDIRLGNSRADALKSFAARLEIPEVSSFVSVLVQSVPFLMFVVPRIYFSLHPDPILNTRGKLDMDPRIRIAFFAMLIGFTGLFFWLQSVRVRVARLERRLGDS